MKYTIKTVISDILIAAAKAVALYFLLSSVTYGLLLAMPSIGSLSTVATYLATIGVIGLSCALGMAAIGLICTPFAVANFHDEVGPDVFPFKSWLRSIIVESLTVAFLLSVGFSIPFFLSILSGFPAFITSTFLSLSAVNCAYFSGGVCFFSTDAIYHVCKYLNQGKYNDLYIPQIKLSHKPIGQNAISSSERPLSSSNGDCNRFEDYKGNSEIPSSSKGTSSS